MNLDIKVIDAISKDYAGIRHVQKTAWLDTYPSAELGITRADIESRFSKDETEEGKRQLDERAASINTDPNSHTFVAQDRGEVVGFCMARRGEDYNRIQSIYVLPKYQGKGIGRRLIEAGFNFFGNSNDILVDVASYNEKAIAFYEKFGFTKTGKDVTSPVAALPSGKTIPEIEMVKIL